MPRKRVDPYADMVQKEARRTDYRYKGYRIFFSSGAWYVSKDGYHITSAPTAQAAEKEVDGLV